MDDYHLLLHPVQKFLPGENQFVAAFPVWNFVHRGWFVGFGFRSPHFVSVEYFQSRRQRDCAVGGGFAFESLERASISLRIIPINLS